MKAFILAAMLIALCVSCSDDNNSTPPNTTPSVLNPTVQDSLDLWSPPADAEELSGLWECNYYGQGSTNKSKYYKLTETAFRDPQFDFSYWNVEVKKDANRVWFLVSAVDHGSFYRYSGHVEGDSIVGFMIHANDYDFDGIIPASDWTKLFRRVFYNN